MTTHMMPSPTLATPQDALDAIDTTTRGLLYVDGVTVDTVSWDAQFGTDRATATTRIVLPLPKPDAVQALSRIEIQGGHNDLTGTLFSGYVPAWGAAMTRSGDTITLRAVGWSHLLTYTERFDLSWDGPITISALFDSLCARRGVPSYRADAVTDPTGSIEITLGDNPNVDDGTITLRANQSPLAFLNSAAEPFGYRVYDTPDGTVRLTRVSGTPTADPVVTFAEGTHLMDASGNFDVLGVVNYPNVEGVTYEDEFGATVPIRAFPATIEASPYVPVNGGVNASTSRSSLLVTQQAAEIAMQVRLIDDNAPSRPVRWDAVAVPGVSPGDVVELDSETIRQALSVDGDVVGNPARYWLTGLDLSAPQDGSLTATYDGWAGGGEALPAGENVTTIPVQAAPVHLGDETLAHYAVPAPSGTSATWSITIPDRATAVNVRGIHHGTNSQVLSGVETDLEVTRWQVWPDGTTDFSGQPDRSGNMPVSAEQLALALDYDNLANWQPFAVNLRSLDPGTYVLRLVAGVKGGVDDFEVRDVVLEVHGIAEPAIVPQEAA